MRKLIFAAGMLFAAATAAAAQEAPQPATTQTTPATSAPSQQQTAPAPSTAAAAEPAAGAASAQERNVPVYSCRRLRRASDISAVAANPLSYWMVSDQVAKIRIGHGLLRTWQSQGVWTDNECQSTHTCVMQSDDVMAATNRERNTTSLYTWQPQDYITVSQEAVVFAICHVIRDPDLPPLTERAPRRRLNPDVDEGALGPSTH